MMIILYFAGYGTIHTAFLPDGK